MQQGVAERCQHCAEVHVETLLASLSFQCDCQIDARLSSAYLLSILALTSKHIIPILHAILLLVMTHMCCVSMLC